MARLSPKQPKSGYLPSLDGWRAVAILAVLLNHETTFRNKTLQMLQASGRLGVFVFFAISGVLMVWRILDDERKVGYFNIKGFYVRRLFRIQPALMVYLLVLAVLMWLSVVPDRWSYWWGSLLSYRNLQFQESDLARAFQDSWFTGQFWTLAVEEHFYILLSLFFLLVRRGRALVLAGCIALLIVGQAWAHHAGLYSGFASSRRSYWVLQYLFLPSLMALLLQDSRIIHAARRYLLPWVAFAVSLIAIYGLYCRESGIGLHRPMQVLAAEENVLCYTFGLWVIATMLHPQSLTTKLLELPPLRFVGRISYSLYLWQQMFFLAENPLAEINSRVLTTLSHKPVHYVVVFVLAIASYYLVEKPLIRLGHALAPPATPGHRDLAAQSS